MSEPVQVDTACYNMFDLVGKLKILYSESQHRLLFRKVWSTMDVINC